MPNDRRDNNNAPTRRAVLLSLASLNILATGGVGSSGAMQGKMNPIRAGYRRFPNGIERCGTCANFIGLARCRVVGGTVEPDGWCRLYVAKT